MKKNLTTHILVFFVTFLFQNTLSAQISTEKRLVRDLAINPNFVAIPPIYFSTLDCFEPIHFMADVLNVGTLPQVNTKLEVKIFNTTGAEVFSSVSTQFPNSFLPNTVMENRILPDSFLRTNIRRVGKFNGYYRVFGDSLDANPTNDTFKFSFWICDLPYGSYSNCMFNTPDVGLSNLSKEDSFSVSTRPANSFWASNEPHSWRIGTFYRINRGFTRPTAQQLIARLNTKAAAGRVLTAGLYEWVDANNDGVVNPTERVLVGIDDTIIPLNTPNESTWLKFYFRDVLTGGLVIMRDSTNYLAMIEWDAPNSTINCNADSCYLSASFSTQYNYAAMQFLTDSLNYPRYNMIIGKTDISDWTTAGFTNQALAPVIRLLTFHYTVPTEDLINEGYNINILPNPVTENSVSIDIQLPKETPIMIKIVDINGQLKYQNKIENASKSTELRLDSQIFNNGLYIIELQTSVGSIFKKFVVSR